MDHNVAVFSLAAIALLTSGSLWIRSSTVAGGHTGGLELGSADLIINRSLQAELHPIAPYSYASEPSAALLPDGSTWAVWKAYNAGTERILGRRVRDDKPEVMVELSTNTGVYTQPKIIAVGPDSAWFFWSAWVEQRWRIVGRHLRNGHWQQQVMLSDDQIHAFNPTAVAVNQNRVVLAWCGFENQRFRIWTREFSAQAWGSSRAVSGTASDAFRPALAVLEDGSIWVFWDAYQDGNYAVFGRPILPEIGASERLSPPRSNSLAPEALASSPRGLCVAWVKVTDVIGGAGVIDQLHTLQMAVRQSGSWTLVRDSKGQTDGAVLTHGLLAKLEPKPVPTGGYMGRRRHPMLLADGDAVWLLWERKSEHAGRTAFVTGDLVGRRYGGKQWETPVVLQRGFVEYSLVSLPQTYERKFVILASDLPREGRRIYHRLIVDLDRHEEYRQDAWTGWQAVELPLPQSRARHQIREGDDVYELYWMDSHAHSALSADAEGEPDELLHYARDRALLDAVVIQENDFYICPLTESEYTLGTFFAACLSRAGKFLALPGYEWTQRLPSEKSIDPAQPYLWEASYPNHRTVIYPPSGGPLVRYTDVNNDITKLYNTVEKHGGVLHTQHPTWDLMNRFSETSIEVTSGWGIYILDPVRIHKALNDGYRLGFVGTSDSHRRNPGLGGGLTGIYARDLTAEAILDAYRKHRVYATNGSRIILEARVNGRIMGQEVKVPEQVSLSLFVSAPRPIRRITLIRDGAEIKTFHGNTRSEFNLTYIDPSADRGRHWYYWRVEQEGQSPDYGGNVKVALGHLAWSSPLWVVKK